MTFRNPVRPGTLLLGLALAGSFVAAAPFAARAGNTVTQSIYSGTLEATLAPLTITDEAISGGLRRIEATTTLQVNDRRGTFTGWSFTLQALAASDVRFELVSVSAPRLLAGSDGAISVASVGDLRTPRQTITAAAGEGSGHYEQSLALTIWLPADADLDSAGILLVSAHTGP